MMQLSIERIWEDKSFFEIEISAKSEFVCAKVRSYTTEESIKALASSIESFPKNDNDRYLWENGTKGDGFPPFVSLEFWCKDRRGHIMIEVYMEIDDGASYNRHNCCFYIETEIGLLNDFGSSLISLCEKGIGRKVTL